jgi:Photosynthesis system II assembly factor YCF48
VRSAALLGLLAALLAAGCGADGASGGSPAAERERSDRLVDFSKKPPYVNALDVDPATGDFLMTTNRGFWRIDPATDAIERVKGTVTEGKRSSPVGTFLELLVTGPGRLLGSGHPDSKAQLPPYLGLIASDDGGATWEVVSRLGEADLHKIIVKHDRVYAIDAVVAAVLVSTDGGRTFAEHFTPRDQVLIDLEVDPEDPDRLFGSTEDQLYRSEDGGQTWRPADTGPRIRLVWTEPGAFFRADQDGTVFRSSDGGLRWEEVGAVPGEPYKFKALAPEHLLLALSDGSVVESKDGGVTWEEVFRP